MKTSRCEFSSIRIPNDPKYATAAAIYVSEIARMIGMPVQDIKSLENGITEAITALIGYSFEPGEKENLEIRCERIPAGLQVSLRDKGLPFGAVGMDSATAEIPAGDGNDRGGAHSALLWASASMRRRRASDNSSGVLAL